MKIRRRLDDGSFGPLEEVFEAEKSAEIVELEQRIATQDAIIEDLMFNVLPQIIEGGI